MSAIALFGCTASHDVSAPGFELEASSVSTSPTPVSTMGVLSGACKKELENSIDGLPDHLECTQLYSNFARKEIATGSGVRSFAPAVWLWSDGANKRRWIYLPTGKKIDASNPNAWTFPIGTKSWKEFAIGDKLIETRIYMKKGEGEWIKGTYAWNDDATAAVRSGEKNFMVGNQQYHIPKNTECDDCHSGRGDRLLGFEQVSLGLPGAEGITLKDLVAEKRLTGFQGPTEYTIGDDGSGVAPDVLGWMNINCGASCHNDNPNAKGNKGEARGLRFQLDPLLLDGRDPSEFPAYATTIGVTSKVLRWQGQTRVVPGLPEDSLLYKLIGQRGDLQQQMPPIASYYVDTDMVPKVGAWIDHMADMAPETGTVPE